jgi:hypothetical protein
MNSLAEDDRHKQMHPLMRSIVNAIAVNHGIPAPTLPELDPEAMAWRTFKDQLYASVELGAIVRILCGVQRRSAGLPPCEVTDLPLKDARRLFDLATETLARLDEEREADAVDAAAIVIYEGNDAGMYGQFADQPLSVQTHYRRLTQSGINAFHNHLVGRDGRLK